MKKHSLTRTLAIALAAPAFVACASTQTQANPTSTMAGGTLAADVIQTVPITTTESELLHRMSNANILGHISLGDSVEQVMAKLAESRTKNDDVLNFARMMDVDHSTDMMQVKDLAKSTGAGMYTISGEMKVAHMGRMVDSLGPQISELTFDRNYILANVQMHQHMLGELQTLQGVTTMPAIRDHITAMLPIIQNHLTRAQEIARKYDYASKHALDSMNPSNPHKP
jgi:predicted outer membrane protein